MVSVLREYKEDRLSDGYRVTRRGELSIFKLTNILVSRLLSSLSSAPLWWGCVSSVSVIFSQLQYLFRYHPPAADFSLQRGPQ